jgi:hypothetical protein
VLAVEREVTHGSEDEEAYEHPAGAGEEGFAAAVVLDDVEAVKSDAEVYAVLVVGSLVGWCRCKGRKAIVTKIICVTKELLMPVPAKTVVP